MICKIADGYKMHLQKIKKKPFHVHICVRCGRGRSLLKGYHVHTYGSVDVIALSRPQCIHCGRDSLKLSRPHFIKCERGSLLGAPNLVPPKRLPRPFLSKCGRDRSYLSRPQTCGHEKHTFLRRGIPRPPICGREKPNIVVVKDLISSSV